MAALHYALQPAQELLITLRRLFSSDRRAARSALCCRVYPALCPRQFAEAPHFSNLIRKLMSLRLVWQHTKESWEYTIPVDTGSMGRLAKIFGDMEHFEQQEALQILCEYLSECCAKFSRRRKVAPTKQMIWMAGFILAHSPVPIAIPNEAVRSREAARAFIKQYGHVLSNSTARTTLFGKPNGRVAPQTDFVTRKLKRVGVIVPIEEQQSDRPTHASGTDAKRQSVGTIKIEKT